ncbi:MAG: 16S rRNA (cytidine(1402)-2'-O)-methyltransferase [Candidatus Geothermincolia bacterium]
MADRGNERGKLYLCATPIGNLEDITLRVLETLRNVDVVAAEDTRRTRNLFSRFDIHKPLVSYREANREAAGAKLVARMEAGEDVALVSDAGMPGISDPGHHLVEICIERGIEIDALPGPSAALTALVVSGLPTRRFAFEGFLPRKKGARRRALEELAADGRTLIFYESPGRVAGTLADMSDVLGDRRVAVARELTKKFSEVLRGTVRELHGELSAREVKGEIVIVLEGAEAPCATSEDEARAVEEVISLRNGGMSLKDAVAAAVENGPPGLSRSAIYNAALKNAIS